MFEKYNFFEQNINFDKIDNVFEIGCCPGRFLKFFHSKKIEINGIDYSKESFNEITVRKWGDIPEFDIVINATSVGLKNENFGLELNRFGNNKFFYYSVQKILKKNGRVYKLKTHFRNRINYIKYLFYYTSQLRVWLGLYPFLIYNLISRDYFILQKLTHKINFSKPHTGKLLYEKFNRCTYKKFSSNMLKFINNN